eukprot:2621596-Rhodomonas_salina.6
MLISALSASISRACSHPPTSASAPAPPCSKRAHTRSEPKHRNGLHRHRVQQHGVHRNGGTWSLTRLTSCSRSAFIFSLEGPTSATMRDCVEFSSFSRRCCADVSSATRSSFSVFCPRREVVSRRCWLGWACCSEWREGAEGAGEETDEQEPTQTKDGTPSRSECQRVNANRDAELGVTCLVTEASSAAASSIWT